MLYADASGKGPPVVLVHGFTQTGRSWGAAAHTLALSHEVITIDAPGHGGSSAVVTDLPGGADLMAEAVARPAAWVGYSMGGRFSLHVALRRPDVVQRLVVVSATGGIDDPAARAARRAADEKLAEKVEEEGVASFVHWWLERPLFATLPAESAGAADRLANTSAGLASSLRRAGAGTQEPLWDRLAALEMPVLVVAGELDTTYVEQARRLVSCVGANAALAVIPGAGHTCHLERPAEFLDAVAPFLDAGESPAPVRPAG